MLDNWDPEDDYDESFRSSHVLDVWIRSRLNTLFTLGNQTIESFDSTTIAQEMERFIVQEFSQWFIRRSRDRVGPNVKNQQAKTEFYSTAYYVLKALTSYLAPFIPFITEEMYQNIKTSRDPKSVHLTSWPTVSEVDINTVLENHMSDVRSIVESVLSKRREVGIKVRQPLASVSISSPYELDIELQNIILDEVNIKTINIAISEESHESYSCDLDLNITEELINEGVLREITRELQQMRKQEKYEIDDKVNVGIVIENQALKNYVDFHKDVLVDKILINTLSDELLAEYDAEKEVSIDGTVIRFTIQKV